MAATTLKVTVPEDQADRVINALCAAAGVSASPAAAKQAVIDWIKATVHNVEAAQQEVTPPEVPSVEGLA